MPLISPVTRARAHRLARTFKEVRAETGSLPRTLRHMARYVARKLRPLAAYAAFAPTRFALVRRLRRNPPSVPAIAVRVLGGIGDSIVIARFLRDLAANIEPAVFDIYSSKPATDAWVFASLPGFRACRHEAAFAPDSRCYAVAAQVSQFVLIEPSWTDQAALLGHPRLAAAVAAVRAEQSSIRSIIDDHPRLDNALAQRAVFADRKRHDYLHAMAGVPYGGDALPLRTAAATGPVPSRYVTVHNGYDPNIVVSHQRATKCYPRFGEVITLLRRRHPSLVVVQIGVRTSEPIPEADIDMIGKTSLAQAAALIQGAMFHLDNEGGLVHLARAVGTRCTVVFGPTSSRYFGYPANVNVDPVFCGGCWWVTETWMNHCPRGFATARCMTEQPPEAVADAAATLLQSQAL